MLTEVPASLVLLSLLTASPTLGPLDTNGCAHEVVLNGRALSGGPTKFCLREVVEVTLEDETFLAIRVDAPHRFEPRVRSRVFLYRVTAGKLSPRFLGSGFNEREVTKLFPLDGALGLETLLPSGETQNLRCVFEGFPLVCA
jgi:hypothetical protein